MDLARLGEFGLLERILKHTARARAGSSRARVLLGPGDDAAVIAAGRGRALAITTDTLVEGVDFLRHRCRPDWLGEKALAVNLSDLAAMGATPRYYLVTLALPARTPVAFVDHLYTGMNALARRHGLALLGGDLSASPDSIQITITAIGEAPANRVVRRAGARPGDVICVTGTLGDARAGLELLLESKTVPSSELVLRQLRPTARIEAGPALAARRLATAMIDLSDGLGADLGHLCAASRVGALIDPARLPLSRALLAFARTRGRDPVTYAVAGGEDFELLFTTPPERARAVQQLARGLRLAISPIGWITPKRDGLRLAAPSGAVPLDARGYEHFFLNPFGNDKHARLPLRSSRRSPG